LCGMKLHCNGSYVECTISLVAELYPDKTHMLRAGRVTP